MAMALVACALGLVACWDDGPSVTAPPIPTSAPLVAPGSSQPAYATVDPAGQGQKFRVWKTFADGDEVLKPILEEWARPLGLEIELISGVSDNAKILAAITAGDPPDLLILSDPVNIGTWAREKLLMPLDDGISAAKIDLSDFYPGPLGLCRYFGALYCLPWGTDVTGLFWNKALFRAAGLDPEKPPHTLEELAFYAGKLTRVDANGNITQLGFMPNYPWSQLANYAMLFGATYYSPDGARVVINSPEMTAAIEWETGFYTRFGYDKVARFTAGFSPDHASPQNGFNSGKLAMMMNGEWQPHMIANAVPKLDYGVTGLPYPASTPSRKGTDVVDGTVIVIPNGVKRPAASLQALAYLQQPDHLADFTAGNHNLPTTRSAAQDGRFRQDPQFAVFLDLLSGPNAGSHTLAPINSELQTAIREVERNAFRDPNMDVQAALDKKAAELQTQLDKVLGK